MRISFSGVESLYYYIMNINRYIISFAVSVLTAAIGSAAPVSPRAARVLAEELLQKEIISVPTGVKKVKGMSLSDETPYYIFNAADSQGGYVIVAGDDRLPAVLGYSQTGKLDLSNAPEGLWALLEMSARSVNGAEKKDIKGGSAPVVAPLLGDINWGQDAPFNKKCPVLSSGKNAYVGCVATAMAQMMRYYSYPVKGNGSASYDYAGVSHNADFGATTYDWANMPAAVPETPTDVQIDAYSTLSYHLGVAVQMQYDAGGSGAYTHLVAPALRKYFGYSPSLRMFTREYYNTDEWMAMIRTELDAGRPVYYSATSEDMLGGHAFVCDGYDSEGYVHINWGWYGNSNGYFYINHLNPGDLGAGAGSGAYNISQEILTGFKPAAAGDVEKSMIYGATRLAGDLAGGALLIMTFIENIDLDDFDGELYVVLTDPEENEIKATLFSQSYHLGGFSNGRPGSENVTLRNIPLSAQVENGEYHIKLAYKSTNDPETRLLRHPIGLPSHIKCRVRNGEITSVEKYEPTPKGELLTELLPDGEIYVNGSARFITNVKNNSSDFRFSKLILTLQNIADPQMSYSKSYDVDVYDLSSKEVIMDLDLPETLKEGEYSVTLCHDKFETLPFATADGKETTVTILPEAKSPVLRFTRNPDPYNATTATTIYKRGDILISSLDIKNYGAAGDALVLMRAVNRDNPEKSTVIKGVVKSWTKGEQAKEALSNTVALDPGMYDCYFYYADSTGKEIPMYAAAVNMEVEECASSAIEVTGFELPSQMKAGERYPYRITIKALRSVNGTFYLRMRQFTYTNGELVNMTSGVRLNAGEEKTIEGNYRVGSTLAEGNYLTMVEFKEGTVTAPASGHSVYYKEIRLGDDNSGVDIVTEEYDEGEESWVTLDGVKIAAPSAPGIYIHKNGSKVSKVIL